MKLIIDNRETSFIDKLNQLFPPLTHQIGIEVARLDLGDMIIRTEDNVEDLVIFERKTIYDLAASIKDGRYNEQSFRLTECPVHNHNIFYLIEGDIERLYEHKAKTKKSVLYSCIASLSFYKGFTVYNTKTLDETCKFIFNFITKLRKEYFNNRIPYYRNYKVRVNGGIEKVESTTSNEEHDSCYKITTSRDKSEDTTEETEGDTNKLAGYTGEEGGDGGVFIMPGGSTSEKLSGIDSKYIYHSPKPRYSEIIKKEKKANITLDNIGEIMLCAIPGVGSQCAYSIMNQYNGSIHDMLVNLAEDPTALDKIKIENNQGQQRKISKSSIDNIKRFMLKINIES